MSNFDRFSVARPSSCEGRLMAAGSDEMPETEALERVARRLGISASVFAAASATTALAPSVAAAKTTAATAQVVASTGVTASLVIKSALVGISIGVGVVATGAIGMRWNSARTHAAATQTTPTGAASSSDSTLHAPPMAPTTEPALSISGPEFGASPPGAVAGLSRTEPSSMSSAVAAPLAIGSVARFEDLTQLEPPPSTSAAQTSAAPRLSTGSSHSLEPTGALRATADSRLVREVASLDRARALAARGMASDAMRELDAFERSYGYVALGTESMLVRIDVLLALGQRPLAVRYARALLQNGVPASQQKRLEELVNGHE